LSDILGDRPVVCLVKGKLQDELKRCRGYRSGGRDAGAKLAVAVTHQSCDCSQVISPSSPGFQSRQLCRCVLDRHRLRFRVKIDSFPMTSFPIGILQYRSPCGMHSGLSIVARGHRSTENRGTQAQNCFRPPFPGISRGCI
jgi:hypothetical protein